MSKRSLSPLNQTITIDANDESALPLAVLLGGSGEPVTFGAATTHDLTVYASTDDAQDLATAIDVATYDAAQVVVLLACDQQKPSIAALATG